MISQLWAAAQMSQCNKFAVSLGNSGFPLLRNAYTCVRAPVWCFIFPGDGNDFSNLLLWFPKTVTAIDIETETINARRSAE